MMVALQKTKHLSFITSSWDLSETKALIGSLLSTQAVIGFVDNAEALTGLVQSDL